MCVCLLTIKHDTFSLFFLIHGMCKGKIAFFSRSAAAISPASSTLFWVGDQLTSWDQYDGMRSALSAMLSGGLSGISMTHSDTGGYTEFRERIYNMLRTEKMLIRCKKKF